MNFTREPIIETIITPREGYKLILRNSKGSAQEELIVEAVEVVSFGHSFFYRSLDRSKSFLVPVSDYEIVEAKEARVALKNVSFEKTIKIAGGHKPPREQEKVVAEEPSETESTPAGESQPGKKRERRRNRRRRSGSEEQRGDSKKEGEQSDAAPVANEGGGKEDEAKVSSSIRSRFIPPPTQLISEKFREKQESSETVKGDVLPKQIDEDERPSINLEEQIEISEDTAPSRDDTRFSETDELQRRMAEPVPAMSTSFSSAEKKSKLSFFGKIW